MILDTRNPKETTRKLLALINEFSTVVDQHIRISCILIHKHWTICKDKTIPAVMASKPIKYLGVDLTKEV